MTKVSNTSRNPFIIKVFLIRQGIGAAGSARAAVIALTDKELLLGEAGAYQLYDRFFAHYLCR